MRILLSLLIVFCLLAQTTPSFAQAGDKIYFKAGILNAKTSQVNTKTLNESIFEGNYYLLLSFKNIPTKKEKAALTKEGIQLLEYIPDNTYLAKVPTSFNKDRIGNFNISSINTVPSFAKINEELKNGNYPSHAVSQNDVSLVLRYPTGMDVNEIGKELEAKGIQVISNTKKSKNTLTVKVAQNKIDELSSLPFVYYLEPIAAPDQKLNYENRQSQSNNPLYTYSNNGRNLSGAGVYIGVGDGGAAPAHPDFSHRIINGTNDTISGFEGHTPHVVGIVMANGNINPKHKGMAPGAIVLTEKTSIIISKTDDYYANYGMLLTNNSYKSGGFNATMIGIYNGTSAWMDLQAYNNPNVLHVFAAGNDGQETVGSYPKGYHTVASAYQSAKNVLTVGATNHLKNYAGFSSAGPVNDGRIKPEVVAVGAGVASTGSANNYFNNAGTSMASPSVVGTLALLVERYRQLYFMDPSAALLKAIISNTADDRGNVGPDFKFGFGIINGLKGVEAIENGNFFENTIANNETKTFALNVPSGTQETKVMLYWHDVEGHSGVPLALVNDLDIKVTSPSGEVFYPLILNPDAAHVTDLAVQGVDHLNNIEQIVIKTPETGAYTIEVKGFNVPLGPQNFVVTYQNTIDQLTLTFPYGDEILRPGVKEYIRWNRTNYIGKVNIDLSTDNGQTWTTIKTNQPSSWGYATWNIPQIITDQALIRLRSTTSGNIVSQSQTAFSIMGRPESITATNVCEGYVNLSWNIIPEAAEYEVMMLDSCMETVLTTTDTFAIIDGLELDKEYWFTMRASTAEGVTSERAIAVSFKPQAGVCPWGDDVKIDQAYNIPTGRANTSSELTNEEVRIRIKNVGNNPVTNVPVGYQLGQNAPVNEVFLGTIAPGEIVDYTFSDGLDVANPGEYEINVWTALPADTHNNNDFVENAVVACQLDNEPITIPHKDDFENIVSINTQDMIFGLSGTDRVDYYPNPLNPSPYFVSEAPYDMQSAVNTKALTMHNFQSGNGNNELYLTYNMENYIDETDNILLRVRQMSHYSNLGGSSITYIRGNDTEQWIPLTNYKSSVSDITSIYVTYDTYELSVALADAGQSFSTSTQIKFQQIGTRSFSYDDIRLDLDTEDVEMIAVYTNAPCGLGSAEPITVILKNNTGENIFNVPVTTTVTNSQGTITLNDVFPIVPAFAEYSYTMTQLVDLSNHGNYLIEATTNVVNDSYTFNNTTNTTVQNSLYVQNFPYYESFEASSTGWVTSGTNNSWSRGVASSSIINKAANGQYAMITNPSGAFSNNELSYLTSPCFNLSGFNANPTLSFSQIFDLDNALVWIEYSEDGMDWTRLGDSDHGTNWYPSANNSWSHLKEKWSVSSIEIPVDLMTDATNVKFRFVFDATNSNVPAEGIAIDDIHIHKSTEIYKGEDIEFQIQNVNGTEWTDFLNNGKRVISINSNGQDLGSTLMQATVHATGIRNTNRHFYLGRNFVVKPSNTFSAPVSLRLYVTKDEVQELINANGCNNCLSINDAYELGVTKYHGINEDDVFENNDATEYKYFAENDLSIVPYMDGYYLEFSVQDFSEFWINGNGALNTWPGELPIELSAFEAYKVDNDALIKWTTATEINNESFEIEVARGDEDFKKGNFVSIAKIDGAGDSYEPLAYEYLDEEAGKSGNRYYRLKQTDFDGSSTLSDVKVVSFEENIVEVMAYPNPFISSINLEVETQTNETVEIHLEDLLGRRIQSIEETVSAGRHNFLLEINSLSADGVYIINVKVGKNHYTKKLIKNSL